MAFTTFAFPDFPDHQTGAEPGFIAFILPAAPDETANTLLERIAGALGASLRDTVRCLVRQPGEEVSLPSFPARSRSLVISFGLPPETFGWWLDTAPEDLVSLEGVTLIRTLSPDRLQADTNAKKVLWAHMQAYLESAGTAK